MTADGMLCKACKIVKPRWMLVILFQAGFLSPAVQVLLKAWTTPDARGLVPRLLRPGMRHLHGQLDEYRGWSPSK
jgi:hypothetical protein